MSSLKKYLGSIKSFKFIYMVNNLFHLKKLKHNKDLYKSYKVGKSIVSPIVNADLKDHPGVMPWMDQGVTAEDIRNKPGFDAFPANIQEQILKWPEQGYIILKDFFSQEEVNAINNDVDRLIKEQKVEFTSQSKRLLFAHKHSKVLKDAMTASTLIQVMEFLLGKSIIPFQSLNFINGSQQRAHSDSIHMTTHPLGYLTAAWIALEPTDEGNGALFYYPGSHKLPYILNEDFNHGGNFFRLGDDAYKNYEEKVQEVIDTNQLVKENFYANPGDVLIWHANILHGGNPVTRKDSTRKSMAIHYYAKDVICYHELTQRPALIDDEF